MEFLGLLVCVKRPAVLEEHRKTGNWGDHLHAHEVGQEGIQYNNYRDIALLSPPGKVYANCFEAKDAAMLLNQIFVLAVAQQTKFLLCRKFSRNLGSMSKTCTHAGMTISTKHTEVISPETKPVHTASKR